MNEIDKIGSVVVDIIIHIGKDGRETMKIKKVSIDGVGGIQHLDLEFNEGFNLICGPNGIGKTTILESIGNTFSIDDIGILKRNVNYSKGEVILEYEDNNVIEKTKHTIKEFDATKLGGVYENNIYKKSSPILVFKTHRDIKYTKLDAVKSDYISSEVNISQLAASGVSSNDIKSWLINRKLFSKQENSLHENQVKNLELALSLLGSLDKSVSFSRIIPKTLDVMINTSKGEIYFEYLSSGYKSCFYILLGIIKELESRFTEPYIFIQDFDGVILIDEIDLHLHPEWQTKLIKVLKDMLPKAQIIATTHSPHIIQNALPSEIVPLVIDKDNNINKKELNLSEYGLQGWTIEEILEDVMGLKSTSSDLYNKTIRDFDIAMDKDDTVKVNECYNILKSMLHPKSTLRKVLEIQMAGLENDSSY